MFCSITHNLFFSSLFFFLQYLKYLRFPIATFSRSLRSLDHKLKLLPIGLTFAPLGFHPGVLRFMSVILFAIHIWNASLVYLILEFPISFSLLRNCFNSFIFGVHKVLHVTGEAWLQICLTRAESFFFF